MKLIKYLTLTSLLLNTFILIAKENVNDCEDSPQGTYTLSIQELVPIKCNGGTGTLRANITVTSGSVTGIAYSWSGGGNTRDVVKAAGTYTVTVTSTNSSSKTATFTILEPELLNVKFTFINDIHPCVSSNGSVQVKIEGGTIPYKLQLLNASNSSIIQEKTNFTGSIHSFSVPAGSYKIKAIDANLCTDLFASTNTLIATTKQFTNAGITTTPATCFQSINGILHSTPEQIIPGITSEFDFDIYDANGNFVDFDNNETTVDIGDLKAGTYTLEVQMDECACPKLIKTFVITQPSQLTNQGSINNVDCFNNSTGTITNFPNGGNGAYNYAWNTGATTKDLNNIIAGTYTVTVTDSKNCTTIPSSQIFVVTQPNQLTNIGTLVTPIQCFGSANGQFHNQTSGGTGAHTYSWSDGSKLGHRLDMKAGTYTLTVSDQKNCKTNPEIQTFIIPQPDQLTVQSSVTDVDCFGGSTGKIILNPIGGNGGYLYRWEHGNFPTTKDVTGLKKGNYSVRVQDKNNCQSIPQPILFTINEPDKIENNGFLIKDVLCFGQRNGEITQAIQGGIIPYNYLWNDGNTLANRDKLLKGNYSCKITDKNKCISNFSYTINEPKALIQIAETIVPQGPQKKGSIFIVTSGGKGQYFYDWTGPNGFKASSEDIFELSQGEYTLSVQDENGCVNEKKYTVPFSTATYDVEFKDVYYVQHSDRIMFKNVKVNQDYNLQLIKSDGSLIRTTQINSINGEIVMDTNSLSAGIYIIQLNNIKHSYNVKVIIY